ncbi:uncharacterized protein EI90DRAFT_2607921 [Cantharellus anzutake]|uniref:uncharacterized protein n=1 Tax=Cantharellus anzutake TaxID=1750568 RepID=UPI001902EACA|nr:uncharacterized protein EI90DRAFT_2607921 [Cantharellus anzutake]KAF8320621.1 hypothetical protein EI90DRAFT_2607921 [Cantharellus anzutake]
MDPVGPILACLMEAALYGAYVALFCWSLWISSGNSTVPRFLRITSFAAVALATTHVVINFLCLWPFMDYLEQYGDVAASYLNLTTVDQPESFSWLTAALPPAHKESVYIILGDVIFISTVVLHDFVLIWRLHVAWNRTYLICIPSVILLLASGGEIAS